VSAFADTVLRRLADPVQVKALVAPSGDTTFEIAKRLFASVYDLPFATLHSVTRVDVLSCELERPLTAPQRIVGTWMQTVPAQTRTDVSYDLIGGPAPPVWLDALARIRVSVVLEVDPGGIESVLIESLDEVPTLAAFRAKWKFLDVDAFFEEHGIASVADLRRDLHVLRGEVKLKAPGPFNAGDPANEHAFELPLALLIRDDFDLTAALRAARLAAQAAERGVAYRPEVDGAVVTAPYAPVLVFPDTGLPAGLTVGSLQTFYTSQRVVALVTSP
jgi:hypothetical protein